jgi:phosphate transport system permease protein
MFDWLGGANDPYFTIGTKENWYYFQLPLGRGILAGALTLMLVVLPIVIISTQEALRAVPNSLREGALAVGATKWQMVRRMTLPAAVPGIMTGAILALSRAIGEAAPMMVIAGIVYITFTPKHLMDEFTVMPLQIFDWAGRPQKGFGDVAATGIIVLLGVLLTFNAVAVFIRQKFHRSVT